MNENIPVPIGKLPLYTKRGMFEEYYNLVVDLSNKIAQILQYRNMYDLDTGNRLSDEEFGEKFAGMDDESHELMRTKFDADDLMELLSNDMDKEGEAFWENHAAELGDWLERLIYHKYACEFELLGVDDKQERAIIDQSGAQA